MRHSHCLCGCVPGTRGHGDGGPLQQIEAPVLLHVVAEQQIARHRDGGALDGDRRCARHQERIERGIGLDQLSLEDEYLCYYSTGNLSPVIRNYDSVFFVVGFLRACLSYRKQLMRDDCSNMFMI